MADPFFLYRAMSQSRDVRSTFQVGGVKMTTFRFVPPSPEVMSMLFMEYRRSASYRKISFRKFLEQIGFTDPAADVVGMDDNARFRAAPAGPELIDVPAQPVNG